MKSALAAREGGKVTASPADGRRRELIDATITAIAEYGLSQTTLARVADLARLSAGTVNFHFTSKEALLLATLRQLAEEFEAALEGALASAGEDPGAALEAVIEVSFDPRVSEARRVSVWHAFWSEVRARREYMAVCGDLDRAYHRRIMGFCEKIVAEAGDTRSDATALARGFTGIIDQLWQDILVAPEGYDREAAKRCCRAYLASVFPWRFAAADEGRGSQPAEAEGQAASGTPAVTLPAWVYDNDEFHALERQYVFLPNWQIVCHISELPEAGDYVTFEMLGERAFVLRDRKGGLGAFHNVCRHRAHAVVGGAAGRCERFLRCPYHGWTYGLDGTLKAVPAEKTFPGLDKSQHGLLPIDLEVFQGFVYIRFEGDGPSVAARMAPYAEELALYRFADMQPLGDRYSHEFDIDWKNVWDNYLEDYHFPIGHPGLSGLMRKEYGREARPGGVTRLMHSMRDKPADIWSVRHYHKLLPEVTHLPEDRRRTWVYYTMFPGVSFDVYPDAMDVFQVIPTAPGKCRLQGRVYGLPDDSREMRAARFLNHRINSQVQHEDNRLTASVQQGLASASYTTGVLSDKEVILKAFQDWLREQLPVARLAEAPPKGEAARRNRAMGGA
jgi:phenylpropionate dioxygenase-like ring-hydroxylating dioxygenase large terminal subunit/AcrR family transcriptional regulator